MRRMPTMILAAAAILFAGFALPAAGQVELEETAVYIEINGTDGDAGIHVFADGEDWDFLRVHDPLGRVILRVMGDGAVAEQGLTELFMESAEPSFDEQPLGELLAMFPAGTYRFRGSTTDGELLVGEATLTHDLPFQPFVTGPFGDDLDPEDVTVSWQLVMHPIGIEIAGYQVVVETDDDDVPLRVFSADMTPDDTEVDVPEQFLKCGGAYKYEVIVIEVSGNRTITEVEFETEPCEGDEEEDEEEEEEDEEEDEEDEE